MKQGLFIKKNEEVWKLFEQYLNGKVKLSPDQLANYYIHITDDLSYARTFYPKSKLINYLNHLALRAHTNVYSNKREKKSRFLNFWKYEVPLAVRKCHKPILYSLIIFCVSIAIGIFSSVQDDEYANFILGDFYINMTDSNIEKGDPMAVYKSAPESDMFFGISSNNIRVSFIAFVLGIFGSILTGLVLFYNGVMVGAFQWYFVKKGLFWLSFSTIFIHGAIELSAIVIAGGAGIAMGNSFLFPGSFPRAYSLVQGARRALKVIIGLVPFFIIAALLESFVTRYYLQLGSAFRMIIVLSSFALMVWYFVVYPIQLEKKLNEEIGAK